MQTGPERKNWRGGFKMPEYIAQTPVFNQYKIKK